MDSRNVNVSTQESNIANRRHRPAELKSSQRDSVDRSNREENDATLPEPTFRQVPVNVARRTGPQVMPLPPPRNTNDREARPERRLSNRKQKRRIDGGNGSDSDSDRDQPNRASDKDGVLAFPKKVSHENQGDDGEGNTEPLEEENERLQQDRMLKKQNEHFAEISQHRQHIRQNATMVIDGLKSFRRWRYDRPPLNKMVICQQENLQDYLEENNNRGKKNGGPSILPEGGTTMVMDRIINDVEAAVVKIYSRWFGKPQSSDKHRHSQVLEVIAGLEENLQSRLSRNAPISDPMARVVAMSHSEYEAYVKGIISLPMPQYIWERRHYSFVDTMIDLMAEQYWNKIMTAILEVAMLLRTQKSIDVSLVDRDWKKVIVQSRKDGQLSSSYIDWVTTGIDPSMPKDFQDKYVRRRGTTDQLLDTTESQEFCPNMMAPRTVSLVLAKGDTVTRITEVSEDDLAGFGWYRENMYHGLWRCQPAGDGRDIVKVDVNGMIKGLFAVERGGSDWHDWVFIKTAKEVSSQPRARPIKESEADVLGLRGDERPKLSKGWLSWWP